MNLKYLENIAIHCKTEDEAVECCELANHLGWTWCQGDSYVDTDNLWSCLYKEDTCYNFEKGTYESLSYYEFCGYTIKSASWFLDNFKIKDMEKEKKGSIAEMYACANDELKKVLESKFTKEELGIKEELPNTWEEFCEHNPLSSEFYIDSKSNFHVCSNDDRDSGFDRNFMPSKESAEAHLAMMQLEQLRDKYRQGWKPDWNDESPKNVIFINGDRIGMSWETCSSRFLSFQTVELRDKFFDNFKDLIEIAKDLI